MNLLIEQENNNAQPTYDSTHTVENGIRFLSQRGTCAESCKVTQTKVLNIGQKRRKTRHIVRAKQVVRPVAESKIRTSDSVLKTDQLSGAYVAVYKTRLLL